MMLAGISGSVFLKPAAVAGADDQQLVLGPESSPGANLKKRGVISHMVHMEMGKEDRPQVRKKGG